MAFVEAYDVWIITAASKGPVTGLTFTTVCYDEEEAEELYNQLRDDAARKGYGDVICFKTKSLISKE